EADAGRVTTLEAERDQANTARKEAEANAAAATVRAAAIEAIADSGHQFTALERRGLLADLPVTENGELDTEAFTTALTEAAAEARHTTGTGDIRGFGGDPNNDADLTEAELDAELAKITGRTPKEA